MLRGVGAICWARSADVMGPAALHMGLGISRAKQPCRALRAAKMQSVKDPSVLLAGLVAPLHRGNAEPHAGLQLDPATSVSQNVICWHEPLPTPTETAHCTCMSTSAPACLMCESAHYHAPCSCLQAPCNAPVHRGGAEPHAGLQWGPPV